MARSRIAKEKEIITLMIRLYCRKKERNKTLCPECESLLSYANSRLEHCSFGEKKHSCKKCPVHCYKPEMKKRIKEVMRYMGPRMIWYAPLELLRHYLK
ncbi:nitrous oxide-stimulated promoter family protein [Barnesiella propionica]|uniref:nitrous oxide-stimulated promoter family protein n=1 Tax=Barnesiella propionica TaxID=2981781 RepID=UPI0011C70BC9|nr:nitrous oxide-stimulated promoter family protein [Barnesiella propionica]MCU6767877.1 nitrous oxide-stimulated promoter family protein [Barnesiella propionica]